MGTSTIATTDFEFPGQTNLYRGKVRDVYTINDKYVVIISTDRISAFDVVLPRQVPYKGQVLNQLAAYYLEATSSVNPNWVISVPDPNVTFGYKCEPVKIELVVRDCLVGHVWRVYQSGERKISGVSLPDGLKEYDRFSKPLLTPTTKALVGHDEDITDEEIVKSGLSTKEEFEEIRKICLSLFAKGQAMAKEKGLYLADTKYELGRYKGKIYVIDEIHTPDSSRYFYLSSYENYLKNPKLDKPKHLSKEFVREWLIKRGFSGQTKQAIPVLDNNFLKKISDRYIELYEQLTRQKFVRAVGSSDITERIKSNVQKVLKAL